MFKTLPFALLLLLVLLSLPPSSSIAANPLVFNATKPTNDLQGTFAAQILFAQSQIMPSHPRQDDVQPHLTSNRKCLLLVRPLTINNETPITVNLRNSQGKESGPIELQPPKLLPKTAYHLDSAPEGPVDFSPPKGSIGTVRGQQTLDKLNDKRTNLLLEELSRHAVVEIETSNGNWIPDIHLPQAETKSGKMVRVKSEAGYSSTIHYSGRSANISSGQVLEFKLLNGEWFLESDLQNNDLVYAKDAWSLSIPAEWITPGLSFEFQQGNLKGKLSKVQIGAPTQLLIHTIDVGMLVPPRNEFAFANDFEAHREYFQTVPLSRLIVSQYAPLTLTEVMMPNGTLLTESDPGTGGWHDGSMRQSIGKELISHGIDNANYGINSQAGEGEDGHPYVVAQLAAHNNRGKYSNGIQVHGGSGGGGIVTLDQSIGNEFSHEVGHNYGLGHYVDGFKGSVHRSAEENNSTWGWDSDKNRFIPNFFPTRSNRPTCIDEKCQAPFEGRSFGLDAMAGGAPFSNFNRFTLYTPNTAAIIQRFLESKAIFDAKSPTGFSRWNPTKLKMEPYQHRINTNREITASIVELTEAKLVEWLTEYDCVKIAMADGDWTQDIPVPKASKANQGRLILIDHSAQYSSDLILNGQKIKINRGDKKCYRSFASRWKEVKLGELETDRKPLRFGVPVVTLIGYYDPQEELQSYIYPALHGACGFCYADDGETMNDSDCHLLVETRDGTLKFRLANYRLKESCMNKFHVNVPEASEPNRVAVVCGGRVISEKAITPVSQKLVMTVNGIVLNREGSK